MPDSWELSFLIGQLQLAVPLLLLAGAALTAEQTGVRNTAIEAMMGAGMACAFIALQFDITPYGLLLGAIGGGVVAAVFVVWVLLFGLKPELCGLILTLFIAALLQSVELGFPQPILAPLTPWPLTFLVLLLLTYPALDLIGRYSPIGVRLRVLGHSTQVLLQAGYAPLPLRTLSLITSGLIAGMAGASSVILLGQAAAINGNGWIALALVMIARWNFSLLLLATLFFVFSQALLRNFTFDLQIPLDSKWWSFFPFASLVFLLALVEAGSLKLRKPRHDGGIITWPSRAEK